jgi:S1/P1 Nuclease
MFKKPTIPFLFLIIILLSASGAKAWDDAGHKTIAYIAWQQMSPAAREKAFNILMSAPEDADLSVFYMQDSRSATVKKRELFMLAATWADIVRDRKFKNRSEKYHKSNWHYADTFWTQENGQVKILPNPSGEDGGKAVEKLLEFDKVLRNVSVSDEEKAIALAWILHLGGDIHQPLHTSARITELEPKGDQGGNLFLLTPKDTPREQNENLHWFWDSILGRIIARNDMSDAEYISMLAEMMMRKYPSAEMQNRLKLGEFGEWQKEGLRLATTDVFSPDLIRYEMPSAKYRRNAYHVSEQQMALAGYRLGAMLDKVFSGQTAVK